MRRYRYGRLDLNEPRYIFFMPMIIPLFLIVSILVVILVLLLTSILIGINEKIASDFLGYVGAIIGFMLNTLIHIMLYKKFLEIFVKEHDKYLINVSRSLIASITICTTFVIYYFMFALVWENFPIEFIPYSWLIFFWGTILIVTLIKFNTDFRQFIKEITKS